ncbi:hypothetical protein CDL12_05397 [Handroanthus impetiginosus]|uniref:GTD-binding domain-containing protein n=1 Tax=Handroanthus impetiginosus TaxID=429701 RepID=A0A2G9HWP0_9LAMI|nr:hypothetical protein CDL12_05397 [Handroanthus impetiginosus]
MADCRTVMSEADVSAVKDTLVAQQHLLQKLYNELDAEREASATAASEALSVILRLQGEKAAVKMEAEQYKRLSEEKIGHAEESLAIIGDAIYQKEMEIAALNHQVQAYRYKLLSVGCVDPENLLQRNDSLGGDIGFQSIGRRNSAPVSLKYEKANNEGDYGTGYGTGQESDLISKVVEKQTGEEVNGLTSDSEKKMDNSAAGNISSYWDQIRKLDIRVKEITGVNHSPSSVSSRNATRSPSPKIGFGNSYDSNKVATVDEADQSECSTNMLKNGSTNVHDVFEVPQDQNFNSCKSLMGSEKKTAFQGSGNLKREYVVHPEATKLYDKDEPEWMKNMLESNNCESNLCKRSDIAAVDRHLAVVQPTTSVSECQPTPNQLNRTSEIIEVERLEESTNREEESTNREEELKLLNEIKEQINLLHDEITSWKVKKSSRRDDPSLCALREAMLYFWL